MTYGNPNRIVTDDHPIIMRLAVRLREMHKGRRTPGTNVWMAFAWKGYARVRFAKGITVDDVRRSLIELYESPAYGSLPKHYDKFFKFGPMARKIFEYCEVDHTKLYREMTSDQRDRHYPNVMPWE